MVVHQEYEKVVSLLEQARQLAKEVYDRDLHVDAKAKADQLEKFDRLIEFNRNMGRIAKVMGDI